MDVLLKTNVESMKEHIAVLNNENASPDEREEALEALLELTGAYYCVHSRSFFVSLVIFHPYAHSLMLTHAYSLLFPLPHAFLLTHSLSRLLTLAHTRSYFLILLHSLTLHHTSSHILTLPHAHSLTHIPQRASTVRTTLPK